MADRSIARESWTDELNSFSREHEGRRVSVTERAPDGRTTVQARDLPLQGVSQNAHGSADIAVSVGEGDDHITHDVHDAVSLRIQTTSDENDRALIIDARDGTRTSVEIRR